MTKTYIKPQDVVSPKASVSELYVEFDGGIYDDKNPNPWGGFSVARMLWDGHPAVGIRWNGNGEWVGTPQSRGLPTWFILPDPFGGVVLDLVQGYLKGGDGAAETPLPRSRLLDLIKFVRSASDEDLTAMIGQLGVRPANLAA
jgi:hypothetical protein